MDNFHQSIEIVDTENEKTPQANVTVDLKLSSQVSENNENSTSNSSLRYALKHVESSLQISKQTRKKYMDKLGISAEEHPGQRGKTVSLDEFKEIEFVANWIKDKRKPTTVEAAILSLREDKGKQDSQLIHKLENPHRITNHSQSAQQTKNHTIKINNQQKPISFLKPIEKSPILIFLTTFLPTSLSQFAHELGQAINAKTDTEIERDKINLKRDRLQFRKEQYSLLRELSETEEKLPTRALAEILGISPKTLAGKQNLERNGYFFYKVGKSGRESLWAIEKTSNARTEDTIPAETLR